MLRRYAARCEARDSERHSGGLHGEQGRKVQTCAGATKADDPRTVGKVFLAQAHGGRGFCGILPDADR
jgi:hypothetical protein